VAPIESGKSWTRHLEAQGWIHLTDREKNANFWNQIDALLDHAWPGPLTIVLPKASQVPDLVTSGLPSVALRCPEHPVAQALLKKSGLGLAAPSANRFGRISPTTADAVASELDGRIAAILDGGECSIGVESTVIQAVEPCAEHPEGALRILRPGKLGRNEIRAWTSILFSEKKHTEAQTQVSPGQLESHYAPETPHFRLSLDSSHWKAELDRALASKMADRSKIKIAVLGYTQNPKWTEHLSGHSTSMHVLSGQQDPETAARSLFATLRKMDAGQFDLILTETRPADLLDSLWLAIEDRLSRASRRL
jgi:L-threonylcarbamoyladenylate synthase